MRYTHILCGVCLLGGLAAGVVWAQEKETTGDVWAMKNLEALRAKAIYDAALARAGKTYDMETRRIETDNAAAVNRACLLLHSALDNAIRKITRSGDLERAIQVREIKSALEKTGVVPDSLADAIKAEPNAERIVENARKQLQAASDARKTQGDKAGAEYEKAFVAAAATLQKAIDKAMDAAARAGELEEAVRLRQAAAWLKNEMENNSRPKIAWKPAGWFRDMTTSREKAPEARQVAERLAATDPEAVKDAQGVDLLAFFDATGPQMKTYGDGTAQKAPGTYAKQALVGRIHTAGGHDILMFGPDIKLSPGTYVVLYRFRIIDRAIGQKTCFLDICEAGTTAYARHPVVKDLPKNEWAELGVRFTMAEAHKFDFRFWPGGRRSAVDRVYLFRLRGGQAGKAD